MYKIGFLGLGKMGYSILNGIINSNLYKKEDICFYAPSDETKEKYINYGINLVSNEKSVFDSSEIIIMAIKPQKYDEALKDLDNLDYNGKYVISLAPGKSISYLQSHIKNATIIRAMPNTPALVNSGVTTLATNDKIDENICNIFKSIGTILITTEEKIDEMIPCNGSMPAYLFEFAKAFIDCAKEYGISDNDAKKLIFNSIIGSCKLALNCNDDIDTLINNVCSKGGSTIAGLNELRDNGFNEAIKKCYNACVKRSKELNNV